MAKGKIPITMHALLQRIARALPEGQSIRAIRRPRGSGDPSKTRYFITGKNSVLETNVSPERVGRALGVLKAWEEVKK